MNYVIEFIPVHFISIVYCDCGDGNLNKPNTGSASLAQVHRAVLRSSNKEVAVKVQHSTVHEHSKIDTVVIEVIIYPCSCG